MYQSCSICSEKTKASVCDKCIEVKNNLAKIHRISTQEFQDKISGSRAAARVAQYSTGLHSGRKSLDRSWWNNHNEFVE